MTKHSQSIRGWDFPPSIDGGGGASCQSRTLLRSTLFLASDGGGQFEMAWSGLAPEAGVGAPRLLLPARPPIVGGMRMHTPVGLQDERGASAERAPGGLAPRVRIRRWRRIRPWKPRAESPRHQSARRSCGMLGGCVCDSGQAHHRLAHGDQLPLQARGESKRPHADQDAHGKIRVKEVCLDAT